MISRIFSCLSNIWSRRERIESIVESKKEGCLFCDIADKKVSSKIIYENDKYIGFLSIYPNTEGVTVVIPKNHYQSNVHDLDDNTVLGLMNSCRDISKILENSFDDVGRVALVFEGLGVDHIHAKLYPLHGTKGIKENWTQIKSDKNEYCEKYSGFISSHDCNLKNASDIEETYKKIMRKF